MTLIQALSVSAFAIATYSAILCLAPVRARPAASRQLSLFLALYAVTFTLGGFVPNAALLEHGWLIPVWGAAILAVGPALLSYVRTMTAPKRARYETYRLALFGLLGAVLGLAWFALSPAERLAGLEGELVADQPRAFFAAVALLVLQVLSHLVTLSFLILSLRLLARHASSVRDFFSNIESRALMWLRSLLLWLSGIWILNALSTFVSPGSLADAIVTGLTMIELAALVLLARGALGQEDLFGGGDDDGGSAREMSPTLTVVPETGETQPRYERSALNSQTMQRIAEKLTRALEQERIASDATLTLADLAKHIGVPRAYVSQTLSQHMETKFYDLVARHRIEHAQELLSDSSFDGTVLEVAYDVGFNSKSTFNAAFKRYTGQTPSAFRAAVPRLA